MLSYTYDVLVSILIPGAILLFAGILILDIIFLYQGFRVFLWQLFEHQLQSTVGFLFATTFLGTFLAAVCDEVEERLLDPWSRKRLNVSANDYEEEWLRYVDSLEVAKNSKNSLRVTWLHFSHRTAWALLALLVTTLFYEGLRYWLVAMILLVQVLILFWFATRVHYRLAQYRHRRFPVRHLPKASLDCLS